MATESKKRLALAIVDFLSTSLKDGTLSSDDAESIEVAQSCIAESFKVDPSDKTAMADALGGQNLLSIYGVYEKLKGKSTASTSGPSSASEARPSTPSAPTAGASTSAAPGAKSAEAEALKGRGNAAMASKDYKSAIDFYTQALAISPVNPIYLSNRAAAYSATHQHDLAKADAEMAVAAEPKYTKAWSRLGLARFALGDAKGSLEAYEKGIEFEGNGGSPAMKKGYETAKKRVEEEEAGDDEARSPSPRAGGGAGAGAGGMPDLSSLAGMFGGGAGGGRGGGGGPDLSSIMNNPMFSQMAQNLMSNPGMMQNIMNNPQVRQMAEGFGRGGAGEGGESGEGGQGGGGGMPDIASLMQDPNIAEILTPSAKTKVKSSAQRAIRAKLVETYPGLAPHIEEIMPKKGSVESVKLPERITIYLLTTPAHPTPQPLCYETPFTPLLPHLRLVHAFPSAFPTIRIDRGAIRFVLSGAALMAPGLTSPGGRLPDPEKGERELEKDEVVAVAAEGKDEVCLVGVLKMGTKEIREKKKGVVLDEGHFLGDALWRMKFE
ncbi:MAG: hypothetical protein M1819_000275 [Sarea resinae]|nr:MAG: hypothetical protein M1819_000275 [Sarea resinae]